MTYPDTPDWELLASAVTREMLARAASRTPASRTVTVSPMPPAVILQTDPPDGEDPLAAARRRVQEMQARNAYLRDLFEAQTRASARTAAAQAFHVAAQPPARDDADEPDMGFAGDGATVIEGTVIEWTSTQPDGPLDGEPDATVIDDVTAPAPVSPRRRVRRAVTWTLHAPKAAARRLRRRARRHG